MLYATAGTSAISGRPAAEHCLGDFVERRMDQHHVTRIEKLLGGEHPHAWQPPQPGAIFLAGNDYLCLGAEPSLLQAQMRSMAANQGELLMSAVYLQSGSPQHRLEQKLAAFMGAEDGVLAQSGWAANVGLLQSIAGPGVPVYLDMQAHASLWEGVQSAQAQPVAFLHNDMGHLQRQVGKHGRGVIVVDALYSTNGSLAPLFELLDIAERSGSIVVVDESHSLGTHGPQGAGLVAQAGLSERVHFRTASLAKAFAGRAGFITCSSRFKGYFLSESRPAIFSSCLLGHELAWFDAALDFIRGADERRAALRRHTLRIRAGLRAQGYNVDDGSEQIIALEAGPEPRTLALRKALERHGIYGAMFCAPATPKNRSLVRLTLNACLSEADIAQLLAACAAIRDETDLGSWSSTRRMGGLALV
ncbi:MULTISPECIES: alpha-hydroxyketone-type quorum-sensing autoinducer synthase [unclassified Janthinobacterium]|uniref:alpha-hydroxyketone-type quorum-sensing autoinducer synthase n=1 Tax=unclassified Janthinobacterium TaxID=2610881 RepID=UPI00034CE195|nr:MULTISPECIES: alpha-hydroxyketone-type quorum-sensing autoinducer synthase [unclassified Janthinobacterium]MEC5162208.1 CAI-1 autoinducer synthase [Janthinobacterium sp. CG_S6]